MVKNCLARIGCLTMILVVVAGGWLYRGDIGDWWTRLQRQSAPSEPSESLAMEAMTKLEELGTSSAPQTIRLTEPELQSLLTFRVGPALPEGVTEPAVEVRDSTLILSAEIDLDAYTDPKTASALRSLLGDSTRVTVEVEPGVIRRGVGQVRIGALQAGALPVPSIMVPMLLEQVEIPGADVAGRTLLFPLPDVMGRLNVANGSLELGTEDQS